MVPINVCLNLRCDLAYRKVKQGLALNTRNFLFYNDEILAAGFYNKFNSLHFIAT